MAQSDQPDHGPEHSGAEPLADAPLSRFVRYDVVSQAPHWDPVTQGVVLRRLAPPLPIEFFAGMEATARALVDRLLDLEDGCPVPVLEMVDARLLARQGDGYRYDDMPEDWEAWRRSIEGLDADARAAEGRPFHDCPLKTQMALIERVATAKGQWHEMPAPKLFALWLRYLCSAYYSHPAAWNEIGFGGPAYPRGYKNIGIDRREPWEVAEVDAEDPTPWVERAEAARRRHAGSLTGS